MTKDTEALARRIVFKHIFPLHPHFTDCEMDMTLERERESDRVLLPSTMLAAVTEALTTPDTIGSHFGNGGGLDPAAGDVGAVEYGDAAQDAVMRLLERGVATVNSDGYLVLAHPPHPAPVDPAETLAQRQAREVMRPQSGSALAQPPFGQVYGMATTPVDPVAGGEALREAVRDALASELGDTYDCGRVWEAWSVGTMGEDDFTPVNDRVDEIADAILAALKGPAA